MTRDRKLLAGATLCFLALAAALGLFWIAWLARGGAQANPYGARAHAFALLAGAMCLLHGAATRGFGYAIAFLAGTWAIGLAAELLGLLTGQIFGRYHYTDAVPGKILGLVPAVVPVVWCVVSYLAWTATGGRWRPGGAGRLARAGLATVLFVAYDLVADPNHLHRGGWVYEGGGAYYGVPLHNFLGWAALGFLSFGVIARLDAWSGPARGGWAERLPVLAYALIMVHEALFGLAFTRAWLPSALALAVAAGTLRRAGGRRADRPAGVSAPPSSAR